MIDPSYPSGAPTGNVYLDSLIWGGSLSSGGGAITVINVAVGGGETVYGVSAQPWTSADLATLRKALQTWENVANIHFNYVSNPDIADLEYFKVSADSMAWLTGDSTTLGFHETPDGSAGAPLYGFFNAQGYGWSSAGLRQGGYGFVTLVHEIGHGLGLAHPHDGGDRSDATAFPGVTDANDTGDYGLNQGIWTVMSYNDGWDQHPSTSPAYGYEGTPMALDIAAIQAIYGANLSTRTGADTYTLAKANVSGTSWSCIWDAGGTDAISNKGGKLSCDIDLRAATLEGEHAGGYVSEASGILGGYTIAFGVVIENAIGGNGSDTLQGNAADNLLEGGRGDDQIIGGTGIDTASYEHASQAVQANLASGTASGSDGNDTLVEIENLLGGRSNDTLSGNDSANDINGGKGNDWIYGSGGNDHLDGNVGNDTLDGGEGDNTLLGGAGNDILLGGSGTDYLYSGAGKDSVSGGAGNDRIDGGDSADILTGGDGADIFVFDNLSSNDRITDFSAEDTLEFDLDMFTRLTSITADNWVAGTKALDANDYLVYNSATGILYYDADGSGGGGAKAIATILGSYMPLLGVDDVTAA